jgi:hypothetical protein
MWPFFRKRQAVEEPTTRRPLSFTQLIEGIGDFSDLSDHDVALKFWLPEPAKEALTELAERQFESMSETLRKFLAVHCYGMYAITIMLERGPKLFRDSEPGLFTRRDANSRSRAKVRIDTYWVPELGKNVAPIKLWLSSRMQHDLQALADHVGIKLSQYLREIVISRLLGHGMVPGRPEMFQAAPSQAADDWCEDREVNWRQVTEEQYRKVDVGKVETHWEDEIR